MVSEEQFFKPQDNTNAIINKDFYFSQIEAEIFDDKKNYLNGSADENLRTSMFGEPNKMKRAGISREKLSEVNTLQQEEEP